MKHELNSQNTKQMLTDTLVSLLSKKSIAKITVSEIVTICNVNRKTFYYHFTDVYDLFEWYLDGEVRKAILVFDPLNDMEATITYAVNYMNDHTYLRNCISMPLAKERISKVLNTALSSKSLEMIHTFENAHGKCIEPDFKEFLVKALTQMTVLSILDAIENPERYDIEKMKKYITHIFDASINGFFEKL